MSFDYIIEHMEEDEQAASERTLPEWVELEYRHMRSLAGPDARVHFTHLSLSSSKALSSVFADAVGESALAKGQAYQIDISQFMRENAISMDKVCLLDPKAERELSPEDGHGSFTHFLFGGILGDDPPRDRTSELRQLGFPSRHLGSVQMTTDTALGVTKLVVQDKIKLQDIPYVDFPTITFNANESVEMPFRYIIKKGEPLLPPGMQELLYKDLDRGFEF